MASPTLPRLREALEKIDRPGSFCVSGSAPAVLPGLEVEGLGPVGLPLTARQAGALKKHCEQAPYGKGEETLVDVNVRRVWRLKPERFSLTNPDWGPFLDQTVRKVREGLGLEGQKLESHLYDLLLYEPGGFFLPHRDGEKLDRMVATLVVVLPSPFEGGELVLRHDGQERVIGFGGGDSSRTHFAAFYADCEHEIRPLRRGHRLCLVYNLTLARSKKGVRAPRTAAHRDTIRRALEGWAADPAAPNKVAVTLEHQYTRDGLTWDALKGVDRARARILAEAARLGGCEAYLALVTLHESGSAEYAADFDRRRYGRRRWDDDEDDEDDEDEGDSGLYEMEEVYETSLTAENWIDPQGGRPPLGPIDLTEGELLDPDALREGTPEEDFEGYTGNEGMTLDRWYRHAAIVLWPVGRRFEVYCDAGSDSAVGALEGLVGRWQRAGKAEAAELRAECIDFAATIIARWQENPFTERFSFGDGAPTAGGALLPRLLASIDEPGLIEAYLSEVLLRDASADPGTLFPGALVRHGWGAFGPELEAVIGQATGETIERGVRLLERVCLARPRQKAEWLGLCERLAEAALGALEAMDRRAPEDDYRAREVGRAEVLAGLARSLLATGQSGRLTRLVDHALAQPRLYPLTAAHVAALTALGPWLRKNVKGPSPALSHWLDVCCDQLEARTARAPEAPADFRRAAAVPCSCADCGELKRFLHDPHEEVHRFRLAEGRRRHLEQRIREGRCDLRCRTDRQGSPYSLVCTKNDASYQEGLKTYHEDQKHLTTLRALQARLPA